MFNPILFISSFARWGSVSHRVLSIALITGTLCLSAFSLDSKALTIKPWSEKEYAVLEKTNQPIALHFFATWCTICRVQESVLRDLEKEFPKGLDVTVFVLDFDTELAMRTRFKVEDRSVLIVNRGKVEKTRLEGNTDKKVIQAALRRAL